MDQSEKFRPGEFYVRSHHSGFVMQLISYRDAGSPPPGMERMYIVCGEGSAISTAEDLQGVLCLETPPKLLETIGISSADKDRPARDISVLSIPWREFLVLKDRSLLSDGPIIDSSADCQRLSKSVTIGQDVSVSKFVRALVLSTYPSRSLNHLQICDPKTCRLSSSAPLNISRLNLSLGTPRPVVLAMNTVLSNSELVECILLSLDMRTLLLTVSRVCKTWSEIIASSPRLQRALFFHPVPTSGDEPLPNPLLKKAFGSPFFDSRDGGPKPRSANSFIRLPWAPRILTKIPAQERGISRAEPSCRQRIFTRAGTSWRRMLVSQPPPPFIGFLWHDSDPRMTMRRNPSRLVEPVMNREKGRLGPARGLTMGQLYDLVFHFAMQEKYFGFYFRIWWAEL